MTIVLLNTAVVGKVTAPLYRNGGESYSAYVFVKDAKGKANLVDSYIGTRSQCNKFRNAAMNNPSLQ